MNMNSILDTRLGLYRLLTALYRYPLRLEPLMALASLDADEADPLARSLRDLQQTPPTLDASVLERLNIEMTRLMEGPGLTPAPPYASYYLNGKQLMGPAAQAARRAYLEWQAVPQQDSIPPDHIALEMGFLAFLAEQAVNSGEDAQMDILRASHSFLREHLLPWLPRFCADLEINSHEPFFSALARFTLQVTDADQIWLEDTFASEPSTSFSENFVNN